MSRPVHISIRDDLRIRLNSGEWVPGQRLPSEAELAGRYGVARMTLRQAIGALASEGVVVRRQGRGTFVADQLPGEQSWLQGYVEEAYLEGIDVQTRLVSAAVVQPPQAARKALQLSRAAAAIVVRRVRLVSGIPIVLLASWLPYARFTGLDTEPLLDGSLYAMIEGPYGVPIVRVRQIFTAAAIEEPDAALLGLRAHEPVLRIVRTAFDGSNLPIEFSMSSRRPSYPIEAVMERTQLTAGADFTNDQRARP
jgi:GntR family transcriptional regulator